MGGRLSRTKLGLPLGARPTTFARDETEGVGVALPPPRVWSVQQQPILAECETPTGHLVVQARPGCLSGDTQVEVWRAGRSFKMPLARLVFKQNTMTIGVTRRSRWGESSWDRRISTRIRANNMQGFIRLADLTAAIDSGMKETYVVVLENGKTIRATGDHRILTSNGWQCVYDLTTSSFVMVEDVLKPRKDKWVKALYHETKINKQKEATHRLVIEAGLNGLSLEDYVWHRRAGDRPLVRLGERQVIHHKDRNHLNNVPSNLEILTGPPEHARLHGLDTSWKHIVASTTPVRVASVEYFGSEPTYDLTVAEVENFLANGIIVHNCGKTTTIEEGVNRVQPDHDVLVCAFNRDIATVMKERTRNPRADVRTVHSLGMRFIGRKWRGVEIVRGPVRADQLTDAIVPKSVPQFARRLISMLHSKVRELSPLDYSEDTIRAIMDEYDLIPDSGLDEESMLTYVESICIMAAHDRPRSVDYADMIFLPLTHGLLYKVYDRGFVDETQDLSVPQLEMVLRVVDGQIVLVGDDRQAIYGFRGADVDSLNRLQQRLGARVLPMTETRRCAHAITRKAALLVPDFTAHPDNPEGVVDYAEWTDMLQLVQPGDFVVSRLNGPLVLTVLALWKRGKRARMAGRDLEQGIRSLVEKLVRRAHDMPSFMRELEKWEQRGVQRSIEHGNHEHVHQVRDKAAVVRYLAEACGSIGEIDRKIGHLFAEDLPVGQVVLCSSIHKIKGQEADTVFVLSDTLYRRGVTREEDNCAFVAYTRAKHRLTLVDRTPGM